MAKKENVSANTSNGTTGATLGEISTIRDILMGQHINDFEARFATLTAKLAATEEKLAQKIKDLSSESRTLRKELAKETSSRITRLENQTDSRFTQLEGETESRVAQLEQSVKDGLADLQQMMEDTSLNDKERIGKLLMDAGQGLMKS